MSDNCTENILHADEGWRVLQHYTGGSITTFSWIGLYLIKHNKQQLVAHAVHADMTALFNLVRICFTISVSYNPLCTNAIHNYKRAC